ncbi:hypothetical protein [Ornithinimicrobium cavernae]|uniref:hypothetical protein n=1 Tax=Ornithinimicrobium cavernae TaxID=2666047 RepID=UPI000D68FBF1|nr:hypothetical protein [Ornithinimicrobium cavernae]
MSSNWDENGTTGQLGQDGPDRMDNDWAAEGAETTAPRTLPRPKGPSWGTVALGLVCLVVAGGALLVELTDVNLDWSSFGPLSLVGLGLLLVLVGLAALVRRNGDEDVDEDYR